MLVHNGFVKKKKYTSLLRAGFEPATYGLQACFTTVHRSTNWAIEGLTELLVHNAKKKNTSLLLAGFEPATNRLQTCFTTVHRSTDWATNDDHEWHFISCELLVHNGFVKKKNYTSLLRAGFEPATYGLQTYFTTAHRFTNRAIEGLTNVSNISFHVNC